MTDQNDSRPGATRPATYHEADGIDWDIVKAQARYEELTDRDLYARSRATLEARGEYDPARHGTAVPEPLTVDERLELLANGEVLARYYRHPAKLAHAVEAGRAGSRSRRPAARARSRPGRTTANGPRASTTCGPASGAASPPGPAWTMPGTPQRSPGRASLTPARRRPTGPRTGFCALTPTTTARAPTGWSPARSARARAELPALTTRPRPGQVGGASSCPGPGARARRSVGPMTGGSDPGADDAHPTLAQQAGTAVSAAVLRLAYLTGAQIVQRRRGPAHHSPRSSPSPARASGSPWRWSAQRGPGCACTSPGRGRRACPGTRSAEPWAWPSWPRRGSSVAEAAWEYAAGRPAHLGGQPGVFRWVCPDCGEVVSDRGPGERSPAEDEQGHAEGCHRLAAAVAEWLTQGADPTKDPPNRRSAVNLCHDHLTCLPCSRPLSAPLTP